MEGRSPAEGTRRLGNLSTPKRVQQGIHAKGRLSPSWDTTTELVQHEPRSPKCSLPTRLRRWLRHVQGEAGRRPKPE